MDFREYLDVETLLFGEDEALDNIQLEWLNKTT